MNLDKMLAFHCAPAIYGIKPANLIAHARFDLHCSDATLKDTKEALQKKNIYMERLWSCPRRELTLVYHTDVLMKHLTSPDIWAYLMTLGYPMNLDLSSILSHLKLRVIESGGFPHEIGVFLGYPLVDVLGFIQNEGKNCKFCGYWKVYGDEHEARNLFESYSRARAEMLHFIQKGMTIPQFIEAA